MHYPELISYIEQQLAEFDKKILDLNNESLLISQQKQKLLLALQELNSIINSN